MAVLEESNYLYPGPLYVVEIVLFLALFGLTVVYPVVGAIRRQQWKWLAAILLTASFAGIAWLLVGRRRPVATA